MDHLIYRLIKSHSEAQFASARNFSFFLTDIFVVCVLYLHLSWRLLRGCSKKMCYLRASTPMLPRKRENEGGKRNRTKEGGREGNIGKGLLSVVKGGEAFRFFHFASLI